MTLTLARAVPRRKILGGLVFLVLGLLTFGWLLNTPAGLLGKADAVGYAVCHRIDVRSFYLGDRPVPLCVRCTGMYLGAVLGLLFHFGRGRLEAGFPSRQVSLILGGLGLAFGLDGVNSYLHLFPGLPTLYQPQNGLRLLTGTGMGVVIAAVLYPAFQQTMWTTWNHQPALGNLRHLAPLLALAVLVAWAVWTGNPLVLYPLALVSAAGVLGVLAMIYAMAWVVVLNQQNRFQRWRELILPLAGGFGLALMQVALIDLGRFLLTGTWDGFHLG